MLDKIISKLLKKSRSKFAFKQDIFRKLEILHLEERITPASLLGINKFQQIDDAVKQAIINNSSTGLVPATSRNDVVVIDSNLIATIPQEEFAGSRLVAIDTSRDVVDQISTALSKLSGVSLVRVISHGSDGSLWFGNQSINSTILASRSIDISAWGQSLTSDADILLYGCSIASTDDGRRFVEQLASLTRADIAASTDITGKGGDVDLEFQVGDVTHHLNANLENYVNSATTLEATTRNSYISSWVNRQNGTATVTMTFDLTGQFYYAGNYY